MLSAGYRQVALAAMRHTAAKWGETMHFAVYERGSVVYVEKVQGRYSPRIPTRTGLRLPAHASAVGKALLAFHSVSDSSESPALARYTPNTIVSRSELESELDKVRSTGIAFDREEAIRGLCCAAVPVLGHDGAILGAISMSAGLERFERHEDAYVIAVREVGARVSRELGA
jgi:DNA-binding IclR family transcriptional regulator